MEIGLYGIHSCNLDKLRADQVVNKIKIMAVIYELVIMLTKCLPDRVYRHPFEVYPLAKLLTNVNGDIQIPSDENKASPRFFRFR